MSAEAEEIKGKGPLPLLPPPHPLTAPPRVPLHVALPPHRQHRRVDVRHRDGTRGGGRRARNHLGGADGRQYAGGYVALGGEREVVEGDGVGGWRN